MPVVASGLNYAGSSEFAMKNPSARAGGMCLCSSEDSPATTDLSDAYLPVEVVAPYKLDARNPSALSLGVVINKKGVPHVL